MNAKDIFYIGDKKKFIKNINIHKRFIFTLKNIKSYSKDISMSHKNI